MGEAMAGKSDQTFCGDGDPEGPGNEKQNTEKAVMVAEE
jgi:hypothetical protein